jgi:hypothetical protein
MLKALFKLFGERKPKVSEPKRASVTSYPDRINIDTYHKIGKETWDWRSAAIVTKLPLNAANEQIGKTTKMHIELTRYNIKIEKPRMGIISDYRYKYLAAHGFETENQLYRDALRVEIYETNGDIILVPTYNGGSSGRDRGFYARDWDAIKCKLTDSDEKLGAKIRKALKRCSD